MKIKVFAVFFIFFAAVLVADEVIWPLDIEIDQSASFAEARGLRLHAGIDLRTKRTTGFPVRAISDGYISRVGVSFRGYGYALYIDHPKEKIRVVYGHLRNFADPLGTYIENKLKKMGSRHGISEFFSRDRYPVKKGQIVAWSGESGAGAAHLHFEVRDLSDAPLAPALYGFRPPDDVFPRMHNFYLEPMSYACVINDSFLPYESALSKTAQSTYSLKNSPKVHGTAAIKIGISDMNLVGNVFGVEEVSLQAEGQELIKRLFHKFSYSESTQAPWVYDYFKTQIRATGYVYNLYKLPFETIPFSKDYPAYSGLINFDASTTEPIKIQINAIDYSKKEIRLNTELKQYTNLEFCISQSHQIDKFTFNELYHTTHSLISIGHSDTSVSASPLFIQLECKDSTGKEHFVPAIIKGNKIEIAFKIDKLWEKGAWLNDTRVLPTSVFITPSGGVVATNSGGRARFNISSTHFAIFASMSQTNFAPPIGGNDKNGYLKPFSAVWSLTPQNQVFDKEVEVLIEPENYSGAMQKIGIYALANDSSYTYLGEKIEGRSLLFDTRVGGDFVILEDLISPALSYAKRGKDFHLGNVWIFKVSDIGKGVDYLSAEATVDNEKAEVYSDPDKKEIYVVRPSKKGTLSLKLQVADLAGNIGHINKKLEN